MFNTHLKYLYYIQILNQINILNGVQVHNIDNIMLIHILFTYSSCHEIFSFLPSP